MYRQVRISAVSYAEHLRTILIDVVLFHAGTTTSEGNIFTSGGRVMAVAAYAHTLQEALDAAYGGVDRVSFKDKIYRRDIGHR
jgi:phosphoribosylamine--glycine ligase/phosphoribosylformylglycinamidine cyclo-ligase